MTASEARPDGAALAAAGLAVLMWGAVPVGTRYLVAPGGEALPPTLLVALRMVISTVVLLPVLLRARPWAWPSEDKRLAALSAGLGIVGYNLPVTLGQVEASAGVTALVIATEPLWILLLWSLKRREQPSPAQVVGALSGLTGVILLVAPSFAGFGSGRGVAWVFLGAFFWSAYSVVVVPLVQKYGAFAVSATTVSIGSLPLTILAIPEAHGMARISGSGALVILLLALGSTVVASLAWNSAVSRLPGPVSGQFLFGIPLVGVVAGHVLLSEAFSANTWFAVGFIAFGLWVSRHRSRSQGSYTTS
ncbi:DMT family transporter [Rhodovulum sulfidophilum]|uniref:DMT family transporter n=1 Tax=Rhodovulum sulfidophilum TaxID=35806 RepID=UPI00192115EF|nr:DMT family transporter [Rhodovulum sulfidophilum]MBL3565830.1 DMT family transporter [Rhodovulum sulfidophilum]